MEKTRETEFGYILDTDIYLKGYMGFPDRRIGQVKTTEEASMKYFEDRYQLAEKKVNDLENAITEAQNKGSYLMKLIHMRDYLTNFDGLGDYLVLFAKLDTLQAELNGMISINRVKNLEIKSALLEEAKTILAEQDIAEPLQLLELSDKMKEVKQKWIKTGAVDETEEAALEKSFDETYQEFFYRRKNIMKFKAKEAKDRLFHYRKILTTADNLKFSDNFEDAFNEFRNLQTEWKTGGKIPHKKATEFWEKFKFANDLFFNRYKSFKNYKAQFPEETPEQIKVKLEKEYCKAGERLVTIGDEVVENVEKAKALLIDWKNLSTTFRNLDHDTAERFRLSCDHVFEYSYLMRVVKRKYPDIETKPKEDQFRIKTSFMRELIRRDESEIIIAENNILREQMNPKFDKKLLTNLAVQKRKVLVKKHILQSMEAALNALKKY